MCALKAFFKRCVRYLIYTLSFGVLSVLLISLWIDARSYSYIYPDIEEVPVSEVGLVLGTSKYFMGGGSNLFFAARMEAAAELYLKGKVQYLLLSGDGKGPYYNEPKWMQAALIAKGVPSTALLMDPRGCRTIDSVLRCRYVFGFENFTVVSQPFHCARAVYLARSLGIDAIAYPSHSVGWVRGFRTRVREYLARVKAMMDVHFSERYRQEKNNLR